MSQIVTGRILTKYGLQNEVKRALHLSRKRKKNAVSKVKKPMLPIARRYHCLLDEG